MAGVGSVTGSIAGVASMAGELSTAGSGLTTVVDSVVVVSAGGLLITLVSFSAGGVEVGVSTPASQAANANAAEIMLM
jgi:hypothetical protein